MGHRSCFPTFKNFPDFCSFRMLFFSIEDFVFERESYNLGFSLSLKMKLGGSNRLSKFKKSFAKFFKNRTARPKMLSKLNLN